MNGAVNKALIEKVVYPAMERFKHNRIRTYCGELQRTQFLPPEELRALQAERLRRLLTVCLRDVPAYRTLPLTQGDIDKDPLEALRRVPVLTKTAFREAPERYLNERVDRGQLIPNSTGGSTGEPLQFYMDRYDVEHYEAARWRGLSWWGIGYGSRCVMVWGSPIELGQAQRRQYQWKERILKNRILLSAYELHENRLPEYLDTLNRYQPEYLYGYATALATLAEFLLPVRERLHLKRLKAVVSTSETLQARQRETIAAAFGCPVVNEYGARDAGILAYECPCGGLHLMAENLIFEVVDPHTYAPLGSRAHGLVAVTDLHNLAMPRLRYLLGDTAACSADTCGCGVRLPLLESLDGREDAMFQLPDGRLVYGSFLCRLSNRYPAIRQFQIVQESPERAVCSVVLWDQREDEAAAFARDIADFLPGVRVAVRVVAEIAPEPSGKHRYAVRKFERRRINAQ